MNDRDLQEFNSAKRMTALVAANASVFSPNTKATGLTGKIDGDIALLETASAASVSGRGLQTDGTQDKQRNVAELELFVRKIAADAKDIKKAEPDFDNTFKIPRGKLSVQKLLDTARAFAADLTTANVAKFGEYGATSTTPQNLQTKIDRVEAASDQQNTGKNTGIAATADTKAIMKRLKANRRTLKTVGENLIESANDAGLLAEWQAACKLEKSTPNDPDPTPAP